LCARAGDPRPVPRTLLVCGHPDDEVLGAGGRWPRLAPGLHVLHLTDGAPRDPADARREGFARREEYAEARRREVECALAVVGLEPARALRLGAVDQEASLDLAGLAARTVEVLQRLQPEVVMAPAYEGGHPDHDAANFVAAAACAVAGRAGAAPGALVEFPLYHATVDGIGPHEFLPAMGAGVGAAGEVVVDLSPGERAVKRRLVACHHTQRLIVSGFPLERERFRLASSHDFARPPHAGRLHYEDRPWGMTGERWRRLAVEARQRLGLSA